jgi:metallophosphoesterase (TIGR00282 family)
VSEIRLLFLGDIVGKPGRELVRKGLPSLIEHYAVDLVIANAENAAAGRGITREIGDQLLNWGVDVMTSGNHIWSQREAVDYIGAEARLLRPANFPAGVPGNGSYLARTAQGRPVGVINVMGRVFMQELDNPFARVLEEIEALRGRTRIIFVDFHAEATSEKIAMGWHLDGKVTAVVGTHTHVQTADEQILPGGTAYLTDVGMTGAARRHHRCGKGGRPRQVSPRYAGAHGNGKRQPAPERHPDCGRRSHGQGDIDSAPEPVGQRTGT